MRFKGYLFFILMLFLIRISNSFVGANEITQENTEEIMNLSTDVGRKNYGQLSDVNLNYNRLSNSILSLTINARNTNGIENKLTYNGEPKILRFDNEDSEIVESFDFENELLRFYDVEPELLGSFDVGNEVLGFYDVEPELLGSFDVGNEVLGFYSVEPELLGSYGRNMTYGYDLYTADDICSDFFSNTVVYSGDEHAI